MSLISSKTRCPPARYQDFQDLADLSHWELSAALSYRIKPDLRFTGTWYDLALGLTWLDYADSEIRDGYLASVDLTAGKRLTDRVSLSGGLGYADREANDGPAGFRGGHVFDTETRSAYLSADYRLTERLTLYGGDTYQEGDVVSTATPNRPIVNWSAEIQPDPALGPGIGGRPRFAYQLSGYSDLRHLGLHVWLSPAWAVDLRVEDVDTQGARDNDYADTLVSAGLSYRFK